MDGQRLGQLAPGEDLDRDALAGPQAPGGQRRERDLRPAVEARVEIGEVHGLRVRAERLEGHRLLHVRAAQLAHPHVDRHLAALEVHAALGARARAGALLAAPGRLAGARALAAADALARLAAARGGLERVQADGLALLGGLLGRAHWSSILTRWRMRCSIPRAGGVSCTSTVWPMRRSPSERSVSRWSCLAPFLLLDWVTFSVAIRR